MPEEEIVKSIMICCNDNDDNDDNDVILRDMKDVKFQVSKRDPIDLGHMD